EERGRGGKGKPFRCKPCQYEAACEEQFVHHIRVHSAKKFLVEESAEKAPPTREAEAGAAAEDVDFSKGPIRCERCGYNTNRYDHYLAHLKHHTKAGENERVYKCTICTYTTVSEYHWKKHLRNHFPRKVYTCSQCSYFSDRKNNYIQHIRTHTGERPYQCAVCPYSSSQKTHLTRHMRTHSGEKPFKCDQCSYVASNQHEVTRHARQVHNGPKPLTCPHCDYKTADRSNFKKHVELHVNPRQFLCPVCDYAASKKCNLQYHIKSRHPDCSDITMDVSKVKLRTKKNEGEFAEGLGDKTEKEQSKGEPVARKAEKVVKAERKESVARERKPTSSVCAGQVTTRSRKSAPENREVDIKTEKSTEKPCKAKKSKRKAEAEAASSREEPAKDSPAVTKKKKKVETKPRDGQEAPESDVVVEEEPRRPNSCPKRSRKKRALRSKQARKSGKGSPEKLEEEQSHVEGPASTTEGMHAEPGSSREQGQEMEQELEQEREQDPELEEELELDQEQEQQQPELEQQQPELEQQQQLELEQQQQQPELGQELEQHLELGQEQQPEVGQEQQQPEQLELGKQQQQLEVVVAAPGGPTAQGQSIDANEDPTQLSLPPHEPGMGPEQEGDPEAAAGEEKDTVDAREEERAVEGAAVAGWPVGPAVEADVDAAAVQSPTQSPVPSLPCTGRLAGSDAQEVDEDEGIHSHEGSDISDNISEGSDDSGLNGARPAREDAGPKGPPGAAGAGEGFVCIFCDRGFEKEGEYSKHLNRHLVNVYYLEKATKGQE
ncbi:REST factor, partial [Eudromia elegans]|nr:REST factor [Eudromia elegans]